MNWHRGLLRLWLVLSLFWIVAVGVFTWENDILKFARMQACSEAKRAQGADAFICGLSEELDEQLHLMSTGVADIVTTTIFKEIVAYALIPPLVMLGVGLLGVWVVSGFAQGCRVGRSAASPYCTAIEPPSRVTSPMPSKAAAASPIMS